MPGIQPVRLSVLPAMLHDEILYINTVVKAAITPLRVAGIRLKQDELADAPRVNGELVMEDWPGNNTFRRPIRVARLYPVGRYTFAPELLPPLFDAQVLRITETQLFISGIENFVDNQQIREVAQTWMVSLA